MKFYTACFALLAAINSVALAQSDLYSDGFVEYNNAISIVPQYTAISGIRIDYERKLKNDDKWLLFAPQLYLDRDFVFQKY